LTAAPVIAARGLNHCHYAWIGTGFVASSYRRKPELTFPSQRDRATIDTDPGLRRDDGVGR
jgi:hypothetical protein